nr:MAG TPA: hypothetical protein [Caudoviricetes sp.]
MVSRKTRNMRTKKPPCRYWEYRQGEYTQNFLLHGYKYIISPI